jgi:hypothetical protein
MKHFLSLLLLLALLLHARAEEWRSEEYGCVLMLPSNEPWQRGNLTRIPGGEMIFSASNMDDKQSVAVLRISDQPTNDIEKPAMLQRLKEMLAGMGLTVANATPMPWNGAPSMQFIARRTNDEQSRIICVARALLYDSQAYIVLVSGRGDENSATDKAFMRVLETFRFLDADELARIAGDAAPAQDLTFQKNRLAFKVCLALAAALVGIFAVMLFGTRGRSR